MLGFPELVVILIIVLVIFGGGKLPAIGDALGRSIRNFKKAAASDDEPQVPPANPTTPATSDRKA